jgi:hypothetical protein
MKNILSYLFPPELFSKKKKTTPLPQQQVPITPIQTQDPAAYYPDQNQAYAQTVPQPAAPMQYAAPVTPQIQPTPLPLQQPQPPKLKASEQQKQDIETKMLFQQGMASIRDLIAPTSFQVTPRHIDMSGMYVQLALSFDQF